MKKTLLIALVLLLTSGMAIAQQRGGPGPGQGGNGIPGNFQDRNSVNHVERLTERLGLDEAQAAAIAVILEDAELVRNEQRETARAIALENRENTHAQIMAVLSPEQQALLEEQRLQREEMRQALKDIRAERGYGRGHGDGDCDN
jgi:Spy/CpxP family protein refolding chaperone